MKSRIAYAGDVSIDWNREELAEGLACYRRGEFFVTHEHWESVWLTLEEPEKSFLQALIQMAAESTPDPFCSATWPVTGPEIAPGERVCRVGRHGASPELHWK